MSAPAEAFVNSSSKMSDIESLDPTANPVTVAFRAKFNAALTNPGGFLKLDPRLENVVAFRVRNVFFSSIGNTSYSNNNGSYFVFRSTRLSGFVTGNRYYIADVPADSQNTIIQVYPSTSALSLFGINTVDPIIPIDSNYNHIRSDALYFFAKPSSLDGFDWSVTAFDNTSSFANPYTIEVIIDFYCSK